MAKFKFFLGAWEWKFLIEIHNFFGGGRKFKLRKKIAVSAKIQITEKKILARKFKLP